MTDILRLALPLTLWLAAFSAIYGLQGLVCSDRWAVTGLSLDTGWLALMLARAAAVGLQVVVLLALRSSRFGADRQFVRWVSVALAGVSLVTTVWTMSPVATTSLCQ